MNRNLLPRLIPILALSFVISCNLPRLPANQPTTTPIPVTPSETFAPLLPSAELGQPENPLILALPPSANSQAEIDAATLIAAQLTERTGYTVVTVIPDSDAALVEAFQKGNAHIALLVPYGYALAHKNESVKAAFAVVKDGKSLYGSQFLATRKAGFTSYFNPLDEINTIKEARVALAQFADKKPCWSDERSPSGYVIPLGFLKANEIATRPAAFVEGHPTVVRSLYAGGICDLGATYIDARKFPSLEDQFPDLIEQVVVIWRIPEIIPYNVMVFSARMPQPMRDLFTSIIPVIMQTDEGKAAFKTLYEIDELQQVNDGFYNEFRTYLDASGLDLTTLIK